MTLETTFSPLSFGKSFMKIRSAVPEKGLSKRRRDDVTGDVTLHTQTSMLCTDVQCLSMRGSKTLPFNLPLCNHAVIATLSIDTAAPILTMKVELPASSRLEDVSRSPETQIFHVPCYRPETRRLNEQQQGSSMTRSTAPPISAC